jgi:hypothetical protein
MGLLKALGDFLFGKSPDIFDRNGQVSHRLTKRYWEAWNNRIKLDPAYNWRQHIGVRSGEPRLVKSYADLNHTDTETKK